MERLLLVEMYQPLNQVRLKDLDKTIKGNIGDYRNYRIENNILTLDMGKDNLISQLAFPFDTEIYKIDDINKEFY